MKNGATVSAFEQALCDYFGCRFAICLNSGTGTLHTALVALGINGNCEVATTPLTMSATALSILHAGALPVYVDVDPLTWLMSHTVCAADAYMPVSLYGLHTSLGGNCTIDDAAQTFRFNKGAAFTSLSFQASKHLSTGEGGALLTNSEELATKAREFSSLGYRMSAGQSRIDPATLKSPDFVRHYQVGWNYRMADAVAAVGLQELQRIDDLMRIRKDCAAMYRSAIDGCDWITPQMIPIGSQHDYWCYTIATDTPEQRAQLSEAMVKLGAEAPYSAWKLSYTEPALTQFAPVGGCPVAESLQPRLLQCQTNDEQSAYQNAIALHKAIRQMSASN